MASEFAVIDRVFRHLTGAGGDVLQGVGDDCALVKPPAGAALAITTDTLVEGVHFPVGTAAADIGWKALACSLSDLAACGARPAWVTLTLVLPAADEAWLRDFATGFGALAAEHDTTLIGGDLVRGGQTMVTVQACGYLPADDFMTRAGARPGDGVYVSGSPGEAAAALGVGVERVHAALRARLDRPTPRVALGRSLVSIASACIDVSDGLAADLGHVLTASGVGARLELSALPVSSRLRAAGNPGQVTEWILSGGDDYELCFTAPPDKEPEINMLDSDLPVISRVGVIESKPGLRLVDCEGEVRDWTGGGYDHFHEADDAF